MGRVWRVELLGGLRARRGEQTVSRFGLGSSGLLLAHLALPVGRIHPREALAEWLWPETPPEQGRTNLRSALAALRRALEPPGIPAGAVLVTDRQTVKLDDAAVTTDVDAFRAACRAATSRTAPSVADRVARLEHAASLYGGELLPGATVDWALMERAALAEQHMTTLRSLVALLEQEGAWEQARHWARQAVAADPLDVASHAALIRLLLLLGEREAGHTCYQAFLRRYRQELETEPDLSFAELVAAAQRTRDATARSRQPPTAGEPASAADAGGLTEDTVSQGAGSTGLLPLPLTQFFGRERELQELAQVLGERRLVTLLGPGGIGKSRLALEVARHWGSTPGRAVWVVALQAVSQPDLLGDQVLIALGLPRSSEGDGLGAIVPVVARQPTLLLLDNFEQLLPAGAAFVQTLLERVPTLTVLVTSRQPLELHGEQEFWVAPLPVPDPVPPGAPVSPQDLAVLSQCPSVTLFVDRARLVRSQFGLTAAGAGTVATLCRELEGIPLALELAAAAMRTNTLSVIHTGLKERLDAFRGGRRFPVRHQTLRAAFDWSYDRLSLDLQRLFRHLAVFRGGWTVEAAHAVCPMADVAGALEQLRQGSLLTVEEGDEERRYQMLETLREYAAEKLGQAEERAAAEERHRQFFQAEVERAQQELVTARAAQWLNRLEREHEDLRAALDRLVVAGEIEGALQMAAGLWPFWRSRGYHREARDRLTGLLALPGAAARTAGRARALLAAGMVVDDQEGQIVTYRSLFAESLAIAREVGDAESIGWALAATGSRCSDDPTVARRLLEEALALAEQTGNRSMKATVLARLYAFVLNAGETERARAHLEESLAIRRELGDPRLIVACLMAVGALAWQAGDYPTGRAQFEECLAIRQALQDKAGMIAALNFLAILAFDQGDYGAAERWLMESRSLCREVDRSETSELNLLGKTKLLQGDLATARRYLWEGQERQHARGRAAPAEPLLLGQLALYEGDLETARCLLEESLGDFRRKQNLYSVAIALDFLGLVRGRQGDNEGAISLLEESLGLHRRIFHRANLVHALESMAELKARAGEHQIAVQLLGAADAARAAMGVPVPLVGRGAHAAQLAALRLALGEARFRAAWDAGKQRSPEAAADHVLELPPPNPRRTRGRGIDEPTMPDKSWGAGQRPD